MMMVVTHGGFMVQIGTGRQRTYFAQFLVITEFNVCFLFLTESNVFSYSLQNPMLVSYFLQTNVLFLFLTVRLLFLTVLFLTESVRHGTNWYSATCVVMS